MPFIIPDIDEFLYDENGEYLDYNDILDFNEFKSFADFYSNKGQFFPSTALLLFHGGQDPVVHPSAYKNDPKKKRDFGDGFYTTDDVEQADRWARRKLDEVGYGATSVYEYTGDLQGLVFEETPFINGSIS